MFIRFDVIHERDGQTDRHCMTAKTALMHRIAWQKCGLRYVKTAIFCTCGSNNWETVEDRWVHTATQFVSIKFSFHPYTFSVIASGASPGETEMWET